MNITFYMNTIVGIRNMNQLFGGTNQRFGCNQTKQLRSRVGTKPLVKTNSGSDWAIAGRCGSQLAEELLLTQCDRAR